MSNVRGPTSALTEFLRERGITARNANRFRRREQEQQEQAQVQAAAASDNAGSTSASPAVASPLPSPVRPRRPLGRNSSSMNFEEDDETDDDLPEAATATSAQAHTTTSSVRQTRASEKRRPQPDEDAAEACTISNGKGKKKSKKGDDDDDDDDDDYSPKNMAKKEKEKGPAPDDWEESLGLPQASSSRTNFSYASRTPGSINYCGVCKNKFTITQYTKMADKGPLCHRCGPLYEGPGGIGADSKVKPAPKKRQVRRKLMQDGLRQSFPSLQSYCIDVVSRHIEDVEALGLIGFRNMDAISKSISKNRSLNPKTLPLFLSPSITTLSLYDCSKLDSEALQSIAAFAPNLQHINLQLCGMLDNDAIDTWSKKLPKLKSVELYGPFLVRKEAWLRFFEVVGSRLESFKIRESPRFDLSCAEAMVQHCPKLRELGLAQIGPLDKMMLRPLESYGDQLTYLDISDPGVSAPGIPPNSLEDDEVISLLKAVGTNLTYLDVSKNIDLSDRIIKEAITPRCHKLKTLRLIGCEKFEAETVAGMFSEWSKEGVPGISHLHLDRVLKLDDSLVEPMLTHSGPHLVELSLNSVDGITDKGLEILANAKNLPVLELLDLSFVRAVDDGSLDKICRNLDSLKKVSVFGCNRISDFMKSDRVRIVGKEKYAL
ncbi:related to RAD7 - nucleotide excision repair protein [Melanopsichium pennsylvanicum]|uniref:Related to RAD7 - nucleotide excision repair protein n=2 Tax=Melanopsichium pennsylvanicum TaxID=63383 RepID=A0AAJ4XJU3_9BASI|nr:related to RAD7-nucleotide excision repair protein [Melanopsichium pennsylvanicum 4]SNX84054.1 related to RAD7 - nucleotide excision repair protein [Melanopsichium pennsylvanicum]